MSDLLEVRERTHCHSLLLSLKDCQSPMEVDGDRDSGEHPGDSHCLIPLVLWCWVGLRSANVTKDESLLKVYSHSKRVLVTTLDQRDLHLQ